MKKVFFLMIVALMITSCDKKSIVETSLKCNKETIDETIHLEEVTNITYRNDKIILIEYTLNRTFTEKEQKEMDKWYNSQEEVISNSTNEVGYTITITKPNENTVSIYQRYDIDMNNSLTALFVKDNSYEANKKELINSGYTCK